MGVNSETLYLKIETNTIVTDRHVKLSDIAKMECANPAIVRQLKQKKVYTFQDAIDEKKKKNQMEVFSVLKIIELIHEEYPNVDVSNEGESDFIVEYIPNPKKPKWMNAVKTILLCIVIFFGSAFTIMAFNNDVGVTDVFSKFYLQVMGIRSTGVTQLEISYCIGLGIGILIFFNHVGRKKITHDPTPIQVEMRKYETDLDTTFIDNAGRKGHNIDVN
ncbi:MAG: stage V sporulation protein AA [Clostridiales bacterium]|nr:stage V sporulation protein AA [Clostridiales bacterium]